MPYGDTPGDATTIDSIDAFGRELFGDVFPTVEKNYRVEANRENRAIAGFSMAETNPAFLGVAAAVSVNRELKLLFLGCGTEDPRYQAHSRLVDLLEKNQIRHEFHATPGEHEWRVWRHLLAEFMPKLFRGAR